VRGAFRVARPDRVAGRRVLLVDDVLTSGATMAECVRVLRRAGAGGVDVLTLARVVMHAED
jgi:predicted amidophosphoribosyltransferase